MDLQFRIFVFNFSIEYLGKTYGTGTGDFDGNFAQPIFGTDEGDSKIKMLYPEVVNQLLMFYLSKLFPEVFTEKAKQSITDIVLGYVEEHVDDLMDDEPLDHEIEISGGITLHFTTSITYDDTETFFSVADYNDYDLIEYAPNFKMKSSRL